MTQTFWRVIFCSQCMCHTCWHDNNTTESQQHLKYYGMTKQQLLCLRLPQVVEATFTGCPSVRVCVHAAYTCESIRPFVNTIFYGISPNLQLWCT